MAFVIARRVFLIECELATRPLKQLRRDDLWHGDQQPFVSRPLTPTRIDLLGIELVVVGLFGRMVARDGLGFAVGRLAGISRTLLLDSGVVEFEDGVY
jgi:hypothetical protein